MPARCCVLSADQSVSMLTTEKTVSQPTTSKKLRLSARLLIAFAPIVYKTYMSIVYYTSRKTFHNFSGFRDALASGQNAFTAVWHQDAVISPFAHRGKRIVTMASHSKDGEIVARILERCGFIPFRGSSSARGREALCEIAGYLKTHRGVWVGISVDGPRGPAFVFKPGLIHLAKITGSPIYCLRSWAKHYVSARSWDRTMIPLPFNHLIFIMSDPVLVPPNAEEEEFEGIRQSLEATLREMKKRSEEYFRGSASE